MDTKPLETIEIATGPAPSASVIWMHGLGADGHDFEPIVPELGLPGTLQVRFIFPNAPVRPVTLNMGMAMRAWYDIIEIGGGREDGEGLRASQAAIEQLIAAEVARGIPASRIVLAGFSQGGAIAFQTGLRHPQRLAGIMALSTYLPLAGTVEDERSAANRDLPVFMAHGSVDPVISISRAQQSRKMLEALGYPLEWHEYPMPHSVCPQEITDISDWLVRTLT
ncbi:MAG: carboxylesterase [Betaproteobacteria bacterium]|jgi:phospholipase/carboxylesterase|nr:carboxylesterase [Betaproteobacteria bacterium]